MIPPLNSDELRILEQMVARFAQRRLHRTVPPQHDRQYLLNVADGPEGIAIYTSEEEGMVDWAQDLPALYVEVAVGDGYVKLGPFRLKSIREGVEEALKK